MFRRKIISEDIVETMDQPRRLLYELTYLDIDEFREGSAAVQPVFAPDSSEVPDETAGGVVADEGGAVVANKGKKGKKGKKKKEVSSGTKTDRVNLTENDAVTKCAELVRKYITMFGAQLIIVETQMDESRRNKVIQHVIQSVCIALNVSCISVRATTKFQFRDPIIQSFCTRSMTRQANPSRKIANEDSATAKRKTTTTTASPALKRAAVDILEHIVEVYGKRPFPEPPVYERDDGCRVIPSDFFYFDTASIMIMVRSRQDIVSPWYKKEFADCILQAMVTMNLMLPNPPPVPERQPETANGVVQTPVSEVDDVE